MLLAKSGGAADKLYVEDVFSTYLYDGAGGAVSINNGIDLAGKGGMVWAKARTRSGGTAVYGAGCHVLYDTNRGINSAIASNLTDGQNTTSGHLTAFNSNGFSLAGNWEPNTYQAPYASWTFRKQPKFFDVQTATANSNGEVTFTHSLGVTPGCVIVKATSSASTWFVYHQSLGTGQYLRLNTTAAAATSAIWTTVNSTTVSTSGLFNSGDTCVAYFFAHNAGGFGLTGTDNVISCGSFSASGTASVSLGYEPQFVLMKESSTTGSWRMFDNMRGIPTDFGGSATLFPNLSDAETSGSSYCSATATGFRNNVNNGATYIYIAIRRGPMKTPTSGTQVYNAIARTGTGVATTVTGVGFAPDVMVAIRRSDGVNGWYSKLTGGNSLRSYDASYEDTTQRLTSYGNDGVSLWHGDPNSSGSNYINHFFRRAPGFFDEVCYTGTGTFPQIVKHNLGVQPEFVIIKGRNDSTSGWVVGVKELGTYPSLYLNGNNPAGDVSYAVVFESTNATDLAVSNNSGINYTAWMWATLPGISKVGKYTGNGTSQTINCGFTGGARFVLIKRTDSTGDWYVWDSARGIVSANDPYLILNTTAAEVTTNDSVDPAATGFTVNQDAATNINVSSGTYIYLAIA